MKFQVLTWSPVLELHLSLVTLLSLQHLHQLSLLAEILFLSLWPLKSHCLI